MRPTWLERPPLTPGAKCTGFVLGAVQTQEGAGQLGITGGEDRQRTTVYAQSRVAPFFPMPLSEGKWEEPYPRARELKW